MSGEPIITPRIVRRISVPDISDRLQILYSIVSGYISDSLRKDWEKWQEYSAVFISAPTGSGKNYFIEQMLYSWHHKRKKVLIISNRIALSRQMKKSLIRSIASYDPDSVFGLLTRIDESSISDLDKISQINNITVKSYQNIEKSEVLNREYDILILDEYHFFLADSQYNKNTDMILKKIIESVAFKTPNATRIFMTATVDEVIFPLCSRIPNFWDNIDWRKSFYENPKNRPLFESNDDSIINLSEIDPKGTKDILVYQFEPEYDHLKVKYFNEDNEIKKKIQKEIKEKNQDKWLIFINNSKKGMKWTKQFGKENAKFINSGSKNSEENQKIISDNEFQSKVLISTSFLDNGINLKMKDLKNIVISNFDRTQFIQMLGRKRDANKSETNLYIRAYNQEYIKKNFTKVNSKICQMQEFLYKNLQVYQEFFDKLFSDDHYFYLTPPDEEKIKSLQVCYNRFSFDKLGIIWSELLSFQSQEEIGNFQLNKEIEFYEKISETNVPHKYLWYSNLQCYDGIPEVHGFKYMEYLEDKILAFFENQSDMRFDQIVNRIKNRREIRDKLLSDPTITIEDRTIVKQLSWIGQERSFDKDNYFENIGKENISQRLITYFGNIMMSEEEIKNKIFLKMIVPFKEDIKQEGYLPQQQFLQHLSEIVLEDVSGLDTVKKLINQYDLPYEIDSQSYPAKELPFNENDLVSKRTNQQNYSLWYVIKKE